ncbi:tetratricopeptide repeat protein [Variovorax boronicumulans]|uniref:tetratricopeptide repeat protein n=1 Tax=Variovorax boronicumulans TaxID=436515 RepID=UPI003396F55E
MKTLAIAMRHRHADRMRACTATALATLAVLVVLSLSGCGTVKDQYAASADAQQRATAEASADTRAGAAIDTKATYLRLVEQMQTEGLWFASLAHIDALEQRWGVSPESTRARADALRQTGQAALSEAAYKRLMGTPLESAGYRGLGLVAGARGNYPEAVQLLKQAQRQTPTDALLLSDLGYASLRAGQIAEARLPLMQALQLRPDNTQAQANLALYFEATGQSEQANKLMDANRMPAATRAAVRDAAQQLRTGGAPLAATDAAPLGAAGVAPLAVRPLSSGTTLARDDNIAPPPLALKASRWAGMGGVRTASQLNPSTADAASSPNPTTARVTP